MARVRLREAARRDLADILDYSIERFGAAVAEAYMNGFTAAFAGLGDQPRMGVVLENIRPPVHCLIYRSHRIFYDIQDDTVWIVRILHVAMDARSRLR